MRAQISLAFVLAISSTGVVADPVTIATWNVSQGTVEGVTRRAEQIASVGTELRAALNGELPSIMVLNEITSHAAAVGVAQTLGFDTATVAISDAGFDRDIWPFALEVAVVSTLPFVSVTSLESTPDEESTPFVVDLASGAITSGAVAQLEVPEADGLDDEIAVPRAVLRVELGGGIVVYAVHLNSSGLGFCRLQDQSIQAKALAKTAEGLGLPEQAEAIRNALAAVNAAMPQARQGNKATTEEAMRRAATREAAAAAIALAAIADVAAGKTVYVAGDFNTPVLERCKTGTDLEHDVDLVIGCSTGITPDTCGAEDGFDDTYAILTDSLAGGERFRILTGDIGRTFASTTFVDSPIDNILIAGDDATFIARKLQDPSGSEDPFGSDHHPVLVVPR